MFNSCDRPCDCCTDYSNWGQSHRPVKWCDTWNVEETFEVNRNCNKLACSSANGPQRMEGTIGCRMLLCIGCKSVLVVQCEQTVVLWSAKNAQFFHYAMWKSDKGLWNVPHLIFHKLPLDNFLHSTVYIPQNTRAARVFCGMWTVRACACTLRVRFSFSDWVGT